jgi:hypothetical protein
MSDDIEMLRVFIGSREESSHTYSDDDAIDAAGALERIATECDRLHGLIDARWAADLKAAKAIFAENGRTSGFPSVKEVVAFYVADVERLEKEVERLCARARDHANVNHEKNVRIDSIRAKLDRATGALADLVADIRDYERVNNLSPAPGKNDCWNSVTRAESVLAEFSAAAPARSSPMWPPSKEWCERMSRAEGDHEIGAGLLAIDPGPSADAPAQQGGGGTGEYAPFEMKPGPPMERGDGGGHCHIIYEHEGQAAEPSIDHPGGHENAPAQQTQISDDVREAMLEVEKTLEPLAAMERGWVLHPDYATAAIAAISKLRSVMK